MLFLDQLSLHSARLVDKPALEFVADDWETINSAVTYGRLNDLVQRAMALLQAAGVGAGDRVALQLPKGLPFVVLHLAALRLGAISLPLNPGYPPDELHYFLEDAAAGLLAGAAERQEELTAATAALPALRARLWIAPDGEAFAARLATFAPSEAPLPADPDAAALMIYTSGTTGRPKGALLTHGNITANLEALHTAWGWREDDRLLHVLPIFHVHGLIVALHGALHAGATAVLPTRFDPRRALEWLGSGRFSVFMGVPTIHRRLLETAEPGGVDLRGMRLITSGSDRLPDDLFHGFQERFGYTLLERYGMSETGMLISNPLHGERRVGSVGLPLPGVAVRIVDPATEAPLPDGVVGMVQVRGANVTPGYWRRPEQTADAFTADGWLRTGDLGLREADGYITLKGRAKELIITGGYNVYPSEVERVLATHPAVVACAVFGCPDAIWGEAVAACVVLRAEAEAPTPDALIAYCRERLIAYKTPRRILLVADLPRNALGKVQKAFLRRDYCPEV